MKTPHLSLKDLFEQISKESAKDPVRHIVAFTYEFDDQQLINLLAGRALDDDFEPRGFDLKRISELAPVVIYDARKTRESQATQHILELLPVRMPPWSCHHPKAYLVVLGRAVHLVTGSMNLTKTGLFNNREVYLHFRWDESAADLEVLADFTDLLETEHASFASASLNATVATLRGFLARCNVDSSARRHHLIASGYSGPSGLARLKALWAAQGGGPLREVLAVSPFFDRGVASGSFADRLTGAFGPCGALTIVTDEAVRAFLSRRHFGSATSPCLRLIPPEISPAELQRIATANELPQRDPLLIQRKLHMKLLALHDGDRTLVYAGSANFTTKAWGGANRELGVAWFHEGKWSTFVRDICEGLAADASNAYNTLSDVPDEDPAQEEDYAELPAYPDFIQGITLGARGDADALHFTVQTTAPERLADYDVLWGQERIRFESGISQALSASTLFAHLLGGRNLAFAPVVSPEETHWIPFRHDARLFAERENYLYANAEDWLAYLVGMDRPLPAHPDEFEPKSDEDDEDDEDDEGYEGDDDASAHRHGNRANNAIVRMQGYLNLFSRAERQFLERADMIARSDPATQAAAWESLVATPLRTLARMLKRSAGSMTESERVFKLGELVQLARNVALRVPGMAPPDVWQEWPMQPSSTLHSTYLAHCKGTHD